MTVAGASLACASGAWLVGDDLARSVFATGAAAAAVTGSVLLRAWDRTAGKSVAELKNARVRDEWKTDERIAELETDLEESRAVRGKLDTKLRAKRAELARLRSEHAELLRRYATAETERASALEGRRLLAIEAGTPARELTAGAVADPAGNVPGALTAVLYHRAAEALRQLPRNAARQAESAQARDGEDGPGNSVAATEPSAAPGRPRTAAASQPTVPRRPGSPAESAAAQPADPSPADAKTDQAPGRDGGASGRTASGQGQDALGADAVPGDGSPDGAREAAEAAADAPEAAQQAARVAPGLRPVPAAAAVVAPVQTPRLPASRVQGGFDFFGTATGTGAVRSTAAQTGPGTPNGAGKGLPSAVPRRSKPVRRLEEDLADVVGDEAVAEQSALGRARTTDEVRAEAGRQPGDGRQSGEGQKPGDGRSTGDTGVAEPAAEAADGDAAADAEAGAEAEASGPDSGDGEVIDLTAHDETEQIDMAELRSAVSS